MEIALYTIHILVAVFLILVILLQQGKGSDLGAAFGGASQTIFGGASGRQSFLVKVTIGLGVAFVLMSLGLSWRASQIHKKGPVVPGRTEEAPLPAAPAPGAAMPATPSTPSKTAPAPSAPMPEVPSPGTPARDEGQDKAPGPK